MNKKNCVILTFMVLCLNVLFTSCGMGSDSNSNSDYYYYEDSSDGSEADEVQVLYFRSTRDVLNYLNGKSFSGDGLTIRFYNNGQSVDVNGSNISNNVHVSDIGLNDNNVAYATVQVVNPAGVTTTFALLAVEGHAQLIDPNDGTVYEY